MKFLKKDQLFEELSNYDFYEDIIHYLGQIISYKGISVDPENIEAIMSCPDPRKMIDIRSFVGLAGYCKRFTEGYSVGKAKSMHRLRNPACELVVP